MSTRKVEIIDRVKAKHRQDVGDYPDDIHYAYTTAGDAYHAICDLHEIDDYSARSLYEQYEFSLNVFTKTMESLLYSADKLKKESIG